MYTHLTLIRGINVGGNNKVPMAILRDCLVDAGFKEVKTYIQSGNVIYESEYQNAHQANSKFESVLEKNFELTELVKCVSFTSSEWVNIINNAPAFWGVGEGMKHNLFIPLDNQTEQELTEVLVTKNPEIEKIEHKNGVFYQSFLTEEYGKTSNTKLLRSKAYSKTTIRNYNTSTILAELLTSRSAEVSTNK